MTMNLRRSIDLNGSPGVMQLVVSIIFGVLALLSVVLRFVSRRISRVYPSMNDYAIVIALAATLVLVISTVISVTAGGAGLSKHQLSDSELRIFWKSMYAIIISWPVAQTMTKISILLFYIHLFPTKIFRYCAYTLIFVVTAWMIQQILTSLLICRPISVNWDASVNGTCGDVASNCLGGAGVNTITDILILILPMPIIWRLHVPLRNKIILSLIFGFGSLICIISIIRLKALFLYTTAPMMNPPYNSDGPLNNTMPVLYTVLESCLGVICACLIIMKPIFKDSKILHSLSRKFSEWSSSSGNSSGDMATKGRGSRSWQIGPPQLQPKPMGQDLRILKTCDIDVELEAAMVAEERREQRLSDRHVGVKREKDTMVDERSASESSISTSARGRGSEVETRQGV